MNRIEIDIVQACGNINKIGGNVGKVEVAITKEKAVICEA